MFTSLWSGPPARRLRLVLGIGLLLGGLLLSVVLFGVSRGTGAAEPDGDLDATTEATAVAKPPQPRISVDPDRTQVREGDTLAIDLKITNPLTVTISQIGIKFDYNRNQITPIATDFDKDEDWVREVTNRRITISFDSIGAKKSRSVTIFFRVNRVIPGDTNVNLRAQFSWTAFDKKTGKRIARGSASRSNDEVLIIAPGNVVKDPNVIDSHPTGWIEPRNGPIGTFFRAYSSGFQAYEAVSSWLNAPGGRVLPLAIDGYANEKGEFYPEFASDQLGPGAYTLVVYGQLSTQTVQIPFTVSGNTPAPPANPPPAAPPVPPVNPPPAPNPTPVPPPAPPAPPVQADGIIEPRVGPVGTFFRSYATGFRPNEGVSVWVNAPRGQVFAIPIDLSANDKGEVWPEFGSNDFEVGDYTLVIYGRDSGITKLVWFSVR